MMTALSKESAAESDPVCMLAVAMERLHVKKMAVIAVPSASLSIGSYFTIERDDDGHFWKLAELPLYLLAKDIPKAKERADPARTRRSRVLNRPRRHEEGVRAQERRAAAYCSVTC